MEYKILESNEENENIDGGAFNDFTAGGESGIISGVLDECKLVHIGNQLILLTGLLIIKGIRVKIISPITLSLVGVPSVDTNFQIIAKVELFTDRLVEFSVFTRESTSLTQQNLYKENKGIYELELARFIYSASGNIVDLTKTCKTLTNKGTNKTEVWTFTLEDGSTITKNVVVG